MKIRAVQRIALTAMLTAVVISSAAIAATAAPSTGRLLLASAGDAVEDSYIVVFKQDRVARSSTGATARRLAADQRGRVDRVFSSALQGFEVTLDEAAARRLAADPAVDFVQQNTIMQVQDTQVNPDRGLDRIDQPRRPEDGRYTYPTRASDVRVYIIDTGIHATHVEFGGRVAAGVDVVFGGTTDDCSGHGTHVAGIAGSATYGVAKGVQLVPVKVFAGCSDITDSGSVIAGVDWVTAHHNPGERAVANMSLGGPSNAAVSTAVARSIADGIVYTLAAGNAFSDACGFSPANVREAITVGGTSLAAANVDDTFFPASSTNWGGCVDLYAPGGPLIQSTWYTSDTATASASGTSMAAPFAAGVAAIVWSMHPGKPANVITSDVVHMASHGTITYTGGGPNRHLYLPQIMVSGLTEVNAFPNFAVTIPLTVVGGVAPYTWTASGLPPAITINPTTGQLSGRMSAGNYSVTVTVTDALGRQGTATAGWTATRVL